MKKLIHKMFLKELSERTGIPRRYVVGAAILLCVAIGGDPGSCLML